MKRALLVLLGIVVAWFAGRTLIFALASDETRIRWMVESMAEGYDERDVPDCIRPLDLAWVHEGYGIDREMARAALLRETLDPNERKLRRRVELDDETFAVSVDDGGAQLSFQATFFRRKEGAEEWTETWGARIEADLEEGEDGWKILRSRHADLRGTQLSR